MKTKFQKEYQKMIKGIQRDCKAAHDRIMRYFIRRKYEEWLQTLTPSRRTRIINREKLWNKTHKPS